MTSILLLVGIALLLIGGIFLVRGASALAEMYGVSPLVVGLTVVAFGTSSPELVVNTLGALRGETALAFGNITGSNIANIALVLGMAALITPVAIAGRVVQRELPLLMLASATLVVMVFDPLLRDSAAMLDRSDAVIMLLLFTIFLYLTIKDLLSENEDALVTEVDSLHISPGKRPGAQILLTVLGAAGLSFGAHLTITHGSALATSLGISPVIIGMFVVAIGTSLPELVTSVVAALNRKADLAVGNVVGSNIFNTMFVLPISALIRPIEVPAGGAVDIAFSLALATSLIFVFVLGKSIMNRTIGACFLVAYFGYMAGRVMLS